jgi:glycosyltransferase involved in cell wall biosynthesis
MAPRFSVVTPVYDPPLDVLGEMIDSVVSQTEMDWELILADDHSPSAAVLPYLRDRAGQDPRIRVLALPENLGIVGASNAAFDAAVGEFTVLIDNDDLLTRDALARVAEAVAAQPDVDYLYSDEDKVGEDGTFYDRFAKPDWSPERLRGHMYTGHLSVLRTSLVRSVGGFRPGYDGSQDHDLALRVTEQARAIVHIPEVLYHWRAISGSAAVDIGAKPYAWDAGVRAVDDHLRRVGIAGHAERGPAPSHYRVVREPDHSPTSIVIPTRGTSGSIHGEERVFVVEAVRSVIEHSDHPELEFVIVADADTPESVIRELEAVAGERLTLVHYDEPFNFSRKCNVGFLAARHDVVVFLNDDTEAISPAVIETLIAPLREPGVGMTGARLLFEDGSLQHGGHRYGNGEFTHAYLGAPPEYPGEFSALFTNREASGLTAACLAVTRDVFERAGGFSETLPVNYNDVDLSKKVHDVLGLRLLWLRDVVLSHFESKTRVNVIGQGEYDAIHARWGVPERDPYLP